MYIVFVLVSVAFIVIPGPNVLVIVSTGIAQGRLRALQTVAGTSTAMAIQLGLVAAGTSWFVQAVRDGFLVLKWSGVAWLLLLVLYHVRRAKAGDEQEKRVAAAASFFTGFITSLANPKTFLFFSAFLPQFVISSKSYAYQITVLSVSFLLLAIIIDSAYAILAGRVWRLVESSRAPALHHRLSAVLYLVAGTWLAMLRRVS